MRIFHIITLSILGGAQTVVTNLANSQVQENEVFVISGIGGDAWKVLSNKIKTIGISQLHRAIGWNDIVVLLKLFYLRFKYNPDIIHLHSSKIGFLGRLAFPKSKIIYTVHGFDSIRVANRRFLWIERLLQYRCAKIVGVSKYDSLFLRKEKIKMNVTYIYNGIDDVSKKKVKYKDASIYAAVSNLKNKYKRILLCIARDDKQKKIDLFFEVARQKNEFAFVWIGNERKYKNAPENVLLLGVVPEAYQYLTLVDLFILPSNYEGLPMSILEAFSFGKPVVASNVGGVSEILDERTGCLTNNTVDDFIYAINNIFTNCKYYFEMCTNARTLYEQNFTVDKMVQAYYLLYKEIINKK